MHLVVYYKYPPYRNGLDPDTICGSTPLPPPHFVFQESRKETSFFDSDLLSSRVAGVGKNRMNGLIASQVYYRADIAS